MIHLDVCFCYATFLVDLVIIWQARPSILLPNYHSSLELGFKAYLHYHVHWNLEVGVDHTSVTLSCASQVNVFLGNITS
jgi:hypothetical protein